MMDVIIPTLLYPEQELFGHLLNTLRRSGVIGKIIIVDNTEGGKFRAAFKHLINQKFEIIEDGIDRYVNPAWNFGVSKCSSEFYLLLNDDVLCDELVLAATNTLLETRDDIGLVTVALLSNCGVDEYEKLAERFSRDNVQVDFRVNSRGGQGCYTAGRVKEWINIPENWKIWGGDNFMYDKRRASGAKPAIIRSMKISHFRSTTAAPVWSARQALKASTVS